MKKYIKNIEKAYKCTCETSKLFKASFEVEKIGRYLMDMIPSLDLPKNFRLKRKPVYLRESLDETIPLRPSPSYVPKLLSNEELLRLNNCKDCEVKLTRFDPKSIQAYIKYGRPEMRARSNSTHSKDGNPSQIESVVHIDLVSEESQNKAESETSATDVPSTSDDDEPFITSRMVSSTPKPAPVKINGATNDTLAPDEDEPMDVDAQKVAEDAEQDNDSQPTNNVEPAFDDDEEIVSSSGDEAAVPDANATAQALDSSEVTLTPYHTGEDASSNPIDVINHHSLKKTLDQLIKTDEHLRKTVNELANKLKAKTQTERNLESAISELKSTVDENKKQLQEKNTELNTLKSTLENLKEESERKEATMNLMMKILNEKLAQKNEEVTKLKQEHDIQIQKAIEDTKSKKWCINCENEAVSTQFKQPVCSEKCVIDSW